ncbi:hypothetical protein SteCoe_21066 [Stentor coeruleus]|uniref:Uncharacterized protein n=1 Tax=Stentor coeruleus TaxID=5963 RepID=A0A1R2BQJ0_9CILI|nr:hypothetical protein SteCoe_21066 [Stentor coeruleus]
MCTYSGSCKITDGSCHCSRLGSMRTTQFGNLARLNANMELTMVQGILRMIMQQNELIRNAQNSLNRAVDMLSKMSKHPQLLSDATPDTCSLEPTNKESLLSYICPNYYSLPYSLSLASSISQPAYKDRCFSISLNIIDSAKHLITLHEMQSFKIFLYTTDNPPKLLVVNTSGDRITRGINEVESNCHILFKKIIINEVSSHYRQGCLFLVIMPERTDLICPLIIENFVVKARKVASGELTKKKKESISDDMKEKTE